jgi:hypothetical protein
MASLEDYSGPVDVDSIITNRNITDPKIIELLRNIALQRGKKEETTNKVENKGAHPPQIVIKKQTK